MATSFVILCPECEKQINVKDELVGKKIRCKSCENVFVVKKPKNVPEPSEEEEEVQKKAKSKPTKKPQEENAEKPEDEGATFKLKEEPKPADSKKKPGADDDDENADPYALAADNKFVPRCPFCTNELESEQTVICKECGYNMVTRSATKLRKCTNLPARKYSNGGCPPFSALGALLWSWSSASSVSSRPGVGWSIAGWRTNLEPMEKWSTL